MDDERYKIIKYYETHVIIEHYIKDEYYSQDFDEKYTFQMFKSEMITKYTIGENLNLTTIIDINDNYITTKMPRFDILIDFKHLFKIDKLKELILFMNKNNIYHNDFAFRNIGIDHQGNYHLIDLSSLSNNIWDKIYIENEIIIYGNNAYLENDVNNVIL